MLSAKNYHREILHIARHFSLHFMRHCINSVTRLRLKVNEIWYCASNKYFIKSESKWSNFVKFFFLHVAYGIKMLIRCTCMDSEVLILIRCIFLVSIACTRFCIQTFFAPYFTSRIWSRVIELSFPDSDSLSFVFSCKHFAKWSLTSSRSFCQH